MGESKTGQVSDEAARVYDEFYVPALFEEWCAVLVEATQLKKGHRVIDVACGSGILAKTVLEQLGDECSIVGIDSNEGMLDVARTKTARIEWRNASAESLPFEDASFDAVLCQFGLMYFEYREHALQEMMRVLRPGGSLAIAVWDKLENNPGLAAEERLWQELFGEEAADDAPYSLGDKQVLRRLLTSSGIADGEIITRKGRARFASIESWIHTGAKGWTEDDAMSDAQLDLLLQKAQTDLVSFESDDGTVEFSTSVHIFVTRK